jgi:hypothetical protein
MTYKDRVYKMLYDLPQGGEFIIEKNVTPENREVFIQIVKDYINFEYDRVYGFVIEFSNDMSKVRKNGVWL